LLNTETIHKEIKKLNYKQLKGKLRLFLNK
jgi:hypothetical protein